MSSSKTVSDTEKAISSEDISDSSLPETRSPLPAPGEDLDPSFSMATSSSENSSSLYYPKGSGDAPGKFRDSGNNMESAEEEPRDWYKKRCFDRFWKHYEMMQKWYCYHKYASYMVWASRNFRFFANPYQNDLFYQNWLNQQNTRNATKYSCNSWMQRNAGKRSKKQKKHRRKLSRHKHQSYTSSSESVHRDTSMEECNDKEEYEMEITEDMMEFFAHSQRHRQKRDAFKKSEENGNSEKLINIEKVNGQMNTATVRAPTEQPGSRRTAEMKILYGKNAAMIHGMETALQMTYDRNMDIKQPRLWPNMPLKLVFD